MTQTHENLKNKKFKRDVHNVLHRCYAVDAATGSLPCHNQTFFQVVDVTDLTTVDWFQQDPPNRVVHWIEMRAVRWPLQWVDAIRCFYRIWKPVVVAPGE